MFKDEIECEEESESDSLQDEGIFDIILKFKDIIPVVWLPVVDEPKYCAVSKI